MKNKILTVFFIFILFSLIFICNNSFAFTIDYNENTYDLPELPFDTTEHPIYLLGIISGNKFAVGYPKEPVEENKIFCSDEGADVPSDYIFRYYIEGTTTNGEWIWFDIPLNDLSSWSSSKTTSHGFLAFYATGKLISSTVDIYESPTSDKIFFQKPPEEIPEIPEETILTPILEKVEMKEPIITTIVGLAKLLIPLLICLIGFWKAWQLLSRTLYKG